MTIITDDKTKAHMIWSLVIKDHIVEDGDAIIETEFDFTKPETPEDTSIVKLHLGFTKNTGKYENFKADVGISIPVKLNDIDKGLLAIEKKCVEKLVELRKKGIAEFVLKRL